MGDRWRIRATRAAAPRRVPPPLLLALALCSASAAAPSASAAEVPPAPAQDPEEAATQDPEAAAAQEIASRVGELYRQGSARFEASDYDAAVELWTQAYALLPDDERYLRQRSRLLLELASAHMRAYEVEGDISHVRKAEPLYVDYLATLDPDDEATAAIREDIATQQERIKSVLDEERRREATRAAVERDRLASAAAEREEAERRAERERLEAAAAAEGRFSASTRKALLISGSVTTVVGAGLLGVMGFGLYQGDQADQEGIDARAREPLDLDELQRIRIEGENANKLAIGAGIAGGLLTAAGVALVVTSQVGRGRQVALSPSTSPRLLGLTLRARF